MVKAIAIKGQGNGNVNSLKERSGLVRRKSLLKEESRKPQSSTAIFTGKSPKLESQLSSIEKMERSNAGITKKDLEMLKTRAELDYDKLARLLSVTRATLINKSGLEKFNAVLSERILSVADIYSYGYEVFENERNFNQWMFQQNHALGGKTPYEFCSNQFGREEVKNIIGRIEYGVYS